MAQRMAPHALYRLHVLEQRAAQLNDGEKGQFRSLDEAAEDYCLKLLVHEEMLHFEQNNREIVNDPR